MRHVPGTSTAMLFAGCLIAAMAGVLWLVVELDARHRPEIAITVANTDVIHVAIGDGAIAPGVYELPPGSRLADLIEVAGGVDESVDVSRVNLARRLEDGEFVTLPEAAIERATPGGTGAAEESAEDTMMGFASGETRLNLNTASLEALDGLPGIGPVLAAAIIAERDRLGGFTSVDQLVGIQGISARMIDEMRELVTVE